MYLSPEQSSWGRDASSFYNHLLNLMYIYSDCDNIVLAGDVNAKIGSMNDFIPDIDQIPVRKVLDTSKNKHGEELVNFLVEANMCICNGRITPQFNNYTYIHTRGKSVIDYIIVPNNALEQCLEFQVKTTRELMNAYCVVSNDGFDVRNIPDHSVLTLKFNTTVNLNCTIEDDHVQHNHDNSHVKNISCDDIYYKRFNVTSLPNAFMNNDTAKDALVKLIDDALKMQKDQDDIDKLYDKFCQFYHNEMKSYLQFKNVFPRSSKQTNKRKTKPFWTDDLTDLWKIVCDSEKAYLRAQGTLRRNLRNTFIIAQKNFDKNYRRAKRNYNKNVVQEIENMANVNPTEFWEKIRNLGPRKKDSIPMEVYDDQGNVVNNHKYVLDKWRDEFRNLFNFVPQADEFDDDFLTRCEQELRNNTFSQFDELDSPITIDEVRKVITHAKNNKAIGKDNLPYEIFKNNDSDTLLTNLFQKIYDFGITPSMWRLAIIKPIPKNSMSDPRLPLEYRGISLLSTVYKLYSGVLNNRIVHVSERNNLLVDEQNGFRKQRSCEDHLFTLTSIIRNRKKSRLPTFVAFVDYEKAFDRVDRNLLFYQLNCLGFGGKMLQSIKNIYSDCAAVININGHLTNSFNVSLGVRQGDTLSPTLFCLFINSLAQALDNSGYGIKLNEHLTVSSLLYADDLAIMAESETDLQCQLNVLQRWCRNWRMRVNIKKTKIVHFRVKSQPKTTVQFIFNNENIDCIDKYRYLGIFLDEHLDFNATATVLASSGTRALGAIFNKFHKVKGFGFSTYTTLYQSGIVPILDYASGIWGYQNYNQIDTVQNKALRFFLGVHRFAPNFAVCGDTGWISSSIRRKINILRFWNRMIKKPNNLLTKSIFLWDLENKRSTGSWSSDVFKIFNELNMTNLYYSLSSVDLGVAKAKLQEQYKATWQDNIKTLSKLKHYCKFKNVFEVESFVYKIHNRRERSLLSQFRFGILPIRIETGRYTQVPPELRLCLFCENDAIENECHFFFQCSLYNDFREVLFEKILDHYPNFQFLDNDEKIKICMNSVCIKYTACFINNSYTRRQNVLYNN